MAELGPARDLGPFTPLLLVGAGHMGGALLAGWRRAGALAPAELMIVDPKPGEEARRWAGEGAVLSPPASGLAAARAAVLAVRPQDWRGAAGPIAAALDPAAPLISIMAGVGLADLRAVLGERPIARAMPNTAAAVGAGAAALFAPDRKARSLALALLAPLGLVAELADEAQLHAATAVCGSGPAYLYAFAEALTAAGRAAGLGADVARSLAEATVVGAAALMESSGEDPARLRASVASPGGTTAAALEVLQGGGALERLLTQAVARAAARSRELAR